jgi:RNase H-fold protein (predicted Holliday junction resolvase)
MPPFRRARERELTLSVASREGEREREKRSALTHFNLIALCMEVINLSVIVMGRKLQVDDYSRQRERRSLKSNRALGNKNEARETFEYEMR